MFKRYINMIDYRRTKNLVPYYISQAVVLCLLMSKNTDKDTSQLLRHYITHHGNKHILLLRTFNLQMTVQKILRQHQQLSICGVVVTVPHRPHLSEQPYRDPEPHITKVLMPWVGQDMRDGLLMRDATELSSGCTETREFCELGASYKQSRDGKTWTVQDIPTCKPVNSHMQR